MSRRKSITTDEHNAGGDELTPEDVEDILEKLHIGTLRRDELKKKRLTVSGESFDDQLPLDDEALEELYRSDRTYAGRHGIRRQSSRSSLGSTASDSSFNGRGYSRQSSISSDNKVQQTTETGIQTTLNRSSSRHSNSSSYSHSHNPSSQDENGNSDGSNHKRKSSTKNRLKKLFQRRSSQMDADEIEEKLDEIPKLPQGFLVKYMGSRPAKGLWGSKYTRGPVEEIVEAIGRLPKGEDLPLVNFEVHYEGLAVRPHSKNKVKSFQSVQIPIQFISYGLQDIVYPRLFCFIMVTELSSQHKSSEVHVYACDSAKSAGQIAACLAVAFQAYSEQLQGKGFKFGMTLSSEPKDELSCDV